MKITIPAKPTVGTALPAPIQRPPLAFELERLVRHYAKRDGFARGGS